MSDQVDKEKLFVWMREIQATYTKQSNDPKMNMVEEYTAGQVSSLMAGFVLAMGLEIKSGRFDVDEAKV